jgi:hypothetical protein
MKRIMSVLLCVLLLSSAATVVAQENITIVGTVSDDFQIIDENGATYDIAETETGFELSENTGAKVKVSGSVEQGENGKLITVKSFELIE